MISSKRSSEAVFRTQGVLQTEQNSQQNKFQKIQTFIEKYKDGQNNEVSLK